MSVPVASAWWTRRRIVAALLLAIAVAAVAFVFRFNALGGTLGGFDDDHFAHLMRSEMLLRGEQPLRDFADAELRGAWPALSYAVPAWAQRIGGRTLLSEAVLTAGALAIAYAIVFLLALDLSKRWPIALLAAVAAIATGPKLYNYPKILMLALGALAVRALAASGSRWALAFAGLITAAAALFRHDYAVYVGTGVLAAFVAQYWSAWREMVRRILMYGGFTALCLMPGAVWVQVYEGIPEYVRAAATSARRESARTELRLSALDLSSIVGADALVLAAYYAFWAVPLLAVAMLVWHSFTGAGGQLSRAQRAIGAGLLTTAVIVNHFFLRANLSQRFGDAVIPVVLLAAWIAGVLAIGSAAARRVALVVPVALLLVIAGSSYVFADASLELDTSGLSDSWGKVVRRFTAARDELRQLPPASWAHVVMAGTLPAARYIAECTAADDRLLLAGNAPEIPVLARRLFAGGQGTVSLSFYTSEADQRRTLDRLSRQSVPIILAEADDYEEGFRSDYPLLAAHVDAHYREAGVISVDEAPRFRVFVRSDRQPTRMDPHLGLPCFR